MDEEISMGKRAIDTRMEQLWPIRDERGGGGKGEGGA